MTIDLWHCQNSRSFRVLWALEELGVGYNLQMMRFPPRVYDKSYLGTNPLGTVPFLRDGTTEMTESCAMVEYIAATHGNGRLARAPGDAEYGAYLNWLHHGEATLTFPQTIVLRYGVFEPEERRLPQAAEDYQAWFLARLRLAEARLSDGRDYLLDSGFSMADIATGYALHLATSIGIGAALPEHCRAYYDRLSSREAFLRSRRIEADAAAEAGLPQRTPIRVPAAPA